MTQEKDKEAIVTVDTTLGTVRLLKYNKFDTFL